MRMPNGYSIAHIPQELQDAARRASDTMQSYLAFRGWDEMKHKWIAIKLADGSHDGTVYDSKSDAVKHQPFEQQCAYVAFRGLGPAGPQWKDMAIWLDLNRKAYRAGLRFGDPDAPDLVLSASARDGLGRIV